MFFGVAVAHASHPRLACRLSRVTVRDALGRRLRGATVQTLGSIDRACGDSDGA